MKLIFVAIAISLLSSCSDYEITLNDQPILLRKPVPVDVTVFDSGLSRCLSETLKMQSHTDISDLNTLDCSFAGIKILDGLEQFQGLVRVKLNGNELSDIGPLLSLGQLTIADLENNNNIPCEQLQVLQGYIGNGLTHSQDCKLSGYRADVFSRYDQSWDQTVGKLIRRRSSVRRRLRPTSRIGLKRIEDCVSCCR